MVKQQSSTTLLRSKGKSKGRGGPFTISIQKLIVAFVLIFPLVAFLTLSAQSIVPAPGGADSLPTAPPLPARVLEVNHQLAAAVEHESTEEIDPDEAPQGHHQEGIPSGAAHAASLIQDPFDQVRDRAQAWLQALPKHYDKAQYVPSMRSHAHDRFQPFSPMADCKDIQEVGRIKKTKGFDDTSKMICGLKDFLETPDCIIYSIGCNNQWMFEEDLLKRTNCQIHTFDCTGPRSRFQEPQHERLHFHHKCLGSEPSVPKTECNENSPANTMCGPLETLEQLQASLGHDRLDLLKMDMEGFEINLLNSWWTNLKVGKPTNVYPNQILMELHYRAYPTMFKLLASPLLLEYEEDHKQMVKTFEFATAVDFVTLAKTLLEMGYVVVARDDNPMCKHCTELVMVRIAESL